MLVILFLSVILVVVWVASRSCFIWLPGAHSSNFQLSIIPIRPLTHLPTHLKMADPHENPRQNSFQLAKALSQATKTRGHVTKALLARAAALSESHREELANFHDASTSAVENAFPKARSEETSQAMFGRLQSALSQDLQDYGAAIHGASRQHNSAERRSSINTSGQTPESPAGIEEEPMRREEPRSAQQPTQESSSVARETFGRDLGGLRSFEHPGRTRRRPNGTMPARLRLQREGSWTLQHLMGAFAEQGHHARHMVLLHSWEPKSSMACNIMASI
ncbi:hypothetical protein K402DRAFT_251841 [Aulographum hederae CBS 113979]|uniref:Uncharacterized protein n=1 Tax=Aulographum hederae CBS 113979 TaxID=1176131 RepID=A0A6G1GJU8_9PEZI|nr:hypothetical protein K402DRAFT_251841 [Aulographum hederae CBS 113979]